MWLDFYLFTSAPESQVASTMLDGAFLCEDDEATFASPTPQTQVRGLAPDVGGSRVCTNFGNVPLRNYQRDLASLIVTVAAREGCVVNLPTGAGKTNIAVAVAFHELQAAANDGKKAAVVMVVPTRDLVTQQAEVFRKHLPRSIGVAYKLGKSVHVLMGENTEKHISSMVFVSTAAMYERNVMPSDPSWMCGSGLPPLDVTTTVFFDEVHHCNKDHPFATAAATIFAPARREASPTSRGLSPQSRPRIVGLSATLSYSTTDLTEVKELLSMMRCGYGVFSNYPNDPYFSKKRAFVFTAPMQLLEAEGFQCAGSAKAMTNEIEGTVAPSNAYKIDDMRSDKLWEDMTMRLVRVVGRSSLKEMLDREGGAGGGGAATLSEGIHPLVAATFALALSLEPLASSSLAARYKINDKYENALAIFKERREAFLQTVVDGEKASPAKRAKAILELRFVAIYMHCMQLLRLVTVTAQRELEAALRGFAMFVSTTAELAEDNSALETCLQEEVSTNPNLQRAEEAAARLKAAIEEELEGDNNLNKFSEVFQLLSGKCRPGILSIVFAESVPICCILSEYLNRRLHDEAISIRTDWYTSQSGVPYFNIPHRSPTAQKKAMEDFRKGETSILVGTTVLEEGIDVPRVQFTVHFTLPNNVVSHVQRKGRSRAADSESFVMDQSRVGSLASQEQLHNIHKDRVQCITLDPRASASSHSSLAAKTDEFDPVDHSFEKWLRSVEIGPGHTYTQVLNESSQKLKNSGRVSHTCVPVYEPNYRASVTVELRGFSIHRESTGKGKKAPLEQAAKEAVSDLKTFLSHRR